MSGSTPQPGRSGGDGQLSLVPTVPHDLEAERAVIGALMLIPDPKRVLRLLGRGLTPECFYRDRHGAIYAAIVSLAKRQVGIDSITVRTEMERLGTNDQATQAQIDGLPGDVPASANVLHYADIVIAKARWRNERMPTIYAMIAAIEKQDESAWDAATRAFVPDAEPEKPSNVVVLRTVNQDGELVGETRHCPECEELRDQVKGLEKDLRSWRTRYANLARDKEAEARADGWWTDAMILYEAWKDLTNHRRSPFTADRFFECAPYLNDKHYGVRKVARAIVGVSYDPFTKPRKNGTLRKFDEWGRIFLNADKFEEWYNSAPSDWESRLTQRARDMLAKRAQASQPEPRVTQEPLVAIASEA